MDSRQIETILTTAVSAGVFPGVTTVVGTRDEVSFFNRGITAPLPEATAVCQDTIYDIASLTKPLTAVATLILLERGFWRLDDAVAIFAPEFDVPDKNSITLRHLLTHTSGLAAHEPLYLACRSGNEMLETIAATPLKHEVGGRVIYSCLGFIVLGQLISRVSGVPLDMFLAKELFKPLSMSDTAYPGVAPVTDPYRTSPTEYCHWRGKLMWGEVHDENAFAQDGVSGNAGVFSTARDMANFAQMILNKGVLNGTRILSETTVELAGLNHTKGLNEGRGLGWQKKASRLSWFGDLAAQSSYGHTGFTGTSLWISPEQDIFTVILSNRVYPTRDNNLHVRFRSLFNNVALASFSSV